MGDSFGLKIGIEGEKEFKNSLKEIDQNFKVLRSEMNLVTSQFDKQDKSMQAVASRNQVLGKEIDEQKNKVEMLRKALENASTSFGENDSRTKAWAVKLNNATATLNNMERELGKNNEKLRDAARGYNDAGDAVDEFGNVIEDTSESVEESSGRLENIGGVLKGVAAGIGVAMAAIGAAVGVAAKKINDCVDVYAAFEDSMLQVAATMGMTSEEIAAGSESYKLLEQAAKDAGANTRYSASEAAEALNYLALAGYDAEKAAATLPGILNLAAAGGMDLATASDMVTDAMSALKMETSEIDVFMDQLAKTSQKSNTNVQQLGEGLLVCAGTATSTGQDLDTVNTALGVLADNGIKGSEGGTKLRNVLLSLAAPTDAAYLILKSLGVSVYDASGNMRQLDDVMTDLNGSLSDLSQEERTNAINAIFNKTDLNAVNFLLESTNGRFEELSETIRDSAGACTDMAETMEAGLAGTERSFNSAVEGMQIEIGALFAMMKQGFMQDATGVIRTFTQNLQEAGGDWTKIGDAVGVLLQDIIGMVSDALPQIMDIALNIVMMIADALMDNLSVIVQVATDIVLTLLDALIEALPALTEGAIQLVMMLVQGIVESLPALVEAAVLMIATIIQGLADAYPAFIPAMVEAVVFMVQAIVDNLHLVVDAALQLVLGLAEGIIAAIPVLIEALPQLIQSIVEFVLGAIPQIIDAGIQLLTAIVGALPEIITAIVEVIPQIIDAIITALIDSLPLIIEAGVNLFVALIDALPEIIGTIVSAIPQIIGSIIEAVLGSIPQLIKAGIQLLVALIGALPEIIITIVAAIPMIAAELVSAILGNIPLIAQTGIDLFVALIGNLPLIVFEIVKAVPQIIKGLVDGFTDSIGKLKEVGGNLIKGLWQGISDAGAWLRNKISSFFGGVVDSIKNFFGIKSPSTLFRDQIGKNLAAGVGIGFSDEMQKVADDMQDSIPTSFDQRDAGPNLRLRAGDGGFSSVSGNGGAFGSLITIQQMIVRSDDDIRRVSQELYNLMNNGSRALGQPATS